MIHKFTWWIDPNLHVSWITLPTYHECNLLLRIIRWITRFMRAMGSAIFPTIDQSCNPHITDHVCYICCDTCHDRTNLHIVDRLIPMYQRTWCNLCTRITTSSTWILLYCVIDVSQSYGRWCIDGYDPRIVHLTTCLCYYWMDRIGDRSHCSHESLQFLSCDPHNG